jgi:flagellar motor protein MotB
MRLRDYNEIHIDIWPAFTDFMTSVLLIVVIFVFAIFFSNIARSLVREHSEFEDMQVRQRQVRKELEARLAGSIEIPPEDGNLQRIILRIDEQGAGGVVFPRGTAILSPAGEQLLSKIVSVLERNRDAYDTIQVEGHTDDVPITGKYASNWELSAARAGAVVNYILAHGSQEQTSLLEPWRFSANGRAEYRPFGMAESNMSMTPAQNPRGGPNLDYIVRSNQVAGQSPLVDNSMAQRNRRIEIILTYKINMRTLPRDESK